VRRREHVRLPVLLTSVLLALLATTVAAPPVAAQEKTATSGLGGAGPVVHGTPDDPLRDPHETHLRHVRQITFGGQNAEAYFS
jgi:hypothetical protein